MPLVVFLFALALYLRTLHPGIAGGDSGELVAVAYRLGVAHPPGYPLYTLLAHAFTLLPYGSVAWRVNLLSAVCDATAAALIFAMLRRLTRSSAAAAVAALLFASSSLVWTYATEAEVFALNNLFVALLLWLAARWNDDCSHARACTLALVAGLGLTNHHTFVLVALPVAAWMVVRTRATILAPSRALPLLACAAAGLLPYLYLPLASAHASTNSWGDPTTLQGFLDVLLRRDYGTFHLSEGEPLGVVGIARHLAGFARTFAHDSFGAAPILVLAAVATVFSRRAAARERTFALLLLAALAFSLCVFASMANLPLDDPLNLTVTSRFWQQGELLAFVLAGIGLAHLLAAAPSEAVRRTVVIVASATVVLQVATSFERQDQSDNRYVEDYGRAVLQDLPDRALLLVHGDLVSNAVRYVHVCENFRPDVVVLDQEMMTKAWYIARAKTEFPDVVFPGLAYHPRIQGDFDLRTFVEINRARREIHVHPGTKSGDDDWMSSYVLIPDGVSRRVAGRGEIDDATLAKVASDRTLAPLDRSWPDERRFPPGTWEYVVLTDVRGLFHARGQWLLDRALARKDDRELFEQARRALAEAAAKWPWPPPWYVSKNFGLAAFSLVRWDPDARADAVRAWTSYLELAPANERDRDTIASELRKLES